MNIEQLVADLRAEADRLDEAILAVEHLARNGRKRRGRPPKWMTAEKFAAGKAKPASKRKVS